MKVLILNPILFTADNNVIPQVKSIKDTMIYNMCLGFKRLGHDVTLAAAEEYAPAEKEALMRQIDQASFAMDDVLLYLDTHPTDQEALNYYHHAAGLRREAMEAWQTQYGPLLVDSVKNMDRWTWMTEKWPWEGEV